MTDTRLHTHASLEEERNPSSFGHWTRLLYMLGFSLLMAAIIYFFASNWPLLTKEWKIGLSVALTGSFYAFSLVIKDVLPAYRIFFERWFVFFGCLSFGVSVALLGQIYNSNADSYRLFLIWFMISFLFSVFTRFVPFDLLSYILFHLTVLFFFFPTSYSFDHADTLRFFVFLGVAIGNALLFMFVERWRIDRIGIKWLSFVALHLILIYLSNSHAFAFGIGVNVFMNVLYLLVLALSVFYVVRKRNERSLFWLTGLITFVFTVAKFFEILSHVFGDVLEHVFMLTLLFVLLLVMANVFVVRRLKRKEGHATEKSRWRAFLRRVLVLLVTVMATFLGAFALIGLTVLTVENRLYETLFVISALGLIVASWMRRLESSIRFPLLGIALIVGLSTAFSSSPLWFVLYQVLIVFAWYRVGETAMKNLAHTAFMLVWLFYFLFQGWSLEVYLILFVFLHALFYAVRFFPNVPVRSGLSRLRFFYFLLGFLSLTIVHTDEGIRHACYNIAFFMVLTTLLMLFHRREEKVEYRFTLTFWFLFFALKYYDFVWSLLHKSVALLLLSLLFIAVAYVMDRRRASTERETAYVSQALSRRWILIALIVLQFGWLGWQIASSEYLLAHGQEIKLELQPIDPRSLLQGDYVTLRYEISNITEEAWQPYDQVQLVLRADEDGIYRYAGIYRLGEEYSRPYEPQAHDVLITGRYDGYSGLVFGIESYFVPEGTGLAWEREARYAYVNVAANGNALLTHLEKGEETEQRER